MSTAPGRLRRQAGRFARIFLTGLLAVLPIVITVAVVLWMIQIAESMLGGLLNALLPGPFYLPGMGLALAVLLIFLVGLGLQGVLVNQLLNGFDSVLNRIPLVKTVYGAVRDLTGMLGSNSNRRFSQVVMVQLPGTQIRLVGFVTIEDAQSAGLPGGDDEVAVYMPMSYQIGGYTLLLPRRCLTPLDMGFEEAMRFVITAGLSRPHDAEPRKDVPPPQR
jgi:uncharacterized membrane protein